MLLREIGIDALAKIAVEMSSPPSGPSSASSDRMLRTVNKPGRAKGEGVAMRPGPLRSGRSNAGGAPMNILLFSMPDSFEHMATIAVRMPNGALTSLAGNVDPHHRVAPTAFVPRYREGTAETQRSPNRCRGDDPPTRADR